MWVPMNSEDVRAYESGDLDPLHVRDSAEGMDVWQPHDLSIRGAGGARICQRCGLMPFDYDAIVIECIDTESEA